MRSFIIAVVLCLSLGTPALSHENHAPPASSLNEAEILARAVEELFLMTSSQGTIDGVVLDQSWQVDKTPAIRRKGKGFYIISFQNKSQAHNLYLLMSDTGTLFDKNFTGQFKGVDP